MDLEESSPSQVSSPSSAVHQDPIPDDRERDSTSKSPVESKDDTLEDWFDDLDATSSPQSDAPRQTIIANRTVSPLLDNSGISSSYTSKSTPQTNASPKENLVVPANSKTDELMSAVSLAPKPPISPPGDRWANMTLDDLASIDELGDVIKATAKSGSQSASQPAKTSTSDSPETLDDFSTMW
jgi:hypothetical protein